METEPRLEVKLVYDADTRGPVWQWNIYHDGDDDSWDSPASRGRSREDALTYIDETIRQLQSLREQVVSYRNLPPPDVAYKAQRYEREAKEIAARRKQIEAEEAQLESRRREIEKWKDLLP